MKLKRKLHNKTSLRKWLLTNFERILKHKSYRVYNTKKDSDLMHEAKLLQLKKHK